MRAPHKTLLASDRAPGTVTGMQYRSEWQVSYPPATDVVLRLIGLTVAAFLLQIVATTFFYPNFAVFLQQHALSFGAAFHPAQLLTHALIMPPGFNGFITALFQCLMLWWFGSELEGNWGSRHFLRFYLYAILTAVALGFLAALIPGGSFLYTGASAGTAAILAAYGMLWPDRQVLFMFFIPMRMKWVIGLLFVVGGLFAILAGAWGHVIQYGGGALSAALFLFYYARQGSTPGRRSPGLFDRLRERQRKKRLRRKQEEINRRIEMKDEVDRLLEKISREGMDSLSRKEKAFLDRSSKEF